MTAADPDNFAQWGPIGQGLLRNCVSWWSWGELIVGYCRMLKYRLEVKWNAKKAHATTLLCGGTFRQLLTRTTEAKWLRRRRLGHCQLRKDTCALQGFIFRQRSLSQKSISNGKQEFANSPCKETGRHLDSRKELHLVTLWEQEKWISPQQRSGLAKRGKLWCWLKSCRTRFLARRQFYAFCLAPGMGMNGRHQKM